MSGYFLAMAARIKPRWILRENVVAPDVVEFKAALEVLGYTCFVIETNSKAFTGQSRARQIVVAFNRPKSAERFMVLVQKEIYKKPVKENMPEQKAAMCIDTRGRGACSYSQNYLYGGPSKGIRCFTHIERELLQGWPIGWTDGISHAGRQRMTGNGVTSPMAEFFGRMIVEVLRSKL
jgi:site-specific DNA-cytosine methylase